MNQKEWVERTETVIGWIERDVKRMDTMLRKQNRGTVPKELRNESIEVSMGIKRLHHQFKMLRPTEDFLTLPTTEDQDKMLLTLMTEAELLNAGIDEIQRSIDTSKPKRHPHLILEYVLWFVVGVIVGSVFF